MHRCIISQSNLLFFLIYFSAKYSSIQNGKIFYLQKMSQPIKKRQIERRVKTSPKYFSFPQRGWSGSKGIIGLGKAIKKSDLKSNVVWPWAMSQVVLKKQKYVFLESSVGFQINLGNVNMGFIACIYLHKPISIYLSLYVSTHTHLLLFQKLTFIISYF